MQISQIEEFSCLKVTEEFLHRCMCNKPGNIPVVDQVNQRLEG